MYIPLFHFLTLFLSLVLSPFPSSFLYVEDWLFFSLSLVSLPSSLASSSSTSPWFYSLHNFYFTVSPSLLYTCIITSLWGWLCNVTTDDRERLGVSSYGVSQTTMEEVFLKVGKGSTNVLYVLVRLYHQIFIVICICYTVMATKSRVVCLVLFQQYN